MEKGLIRERVVRFASAAAVLLITVASGAQVPEALVEYSTPPAPVARLLSASRPPETLLHGKSGRVALLTRQPLVSLERLSRPTLGLAGFRFDPVAGTSERGPLIERVEVLTVSGASKPSTIVWQPGDGALLDHVAFSPDGSHLSATRMTDGPARLVVFDVAAGSERVLETPIQAAWGLPCWWTKPDALLCRVIPSERGEPLPVPPISPFFFADQIEAPLLLVHGGEDPNAGTPPEQARRFFHALVGNGVPVRYVELPHEGHHYAARESVFHAASEMLDWLEGTLGPPPAASSGPVTPDG